MTDSDILSVAFRFMTLRQTFSQIALSSGISRSAVAGIIKRLRDAEPQVRAARLTDLQIKTVLDRHFFGGTSAEAIAKDFAHQGLTRQGVLHLVWWVMHDLHAAGPELLMNPANADVIDWPQWWRRAQSCEAAA